MQNKETIHKSAIEKHLVERAKSIFKEYASEEIEKYKKKLNDTTETMLLDIFNSGITININDLKKCGIDQLQKRLKLHK
jgi:hypothetical protein